VAWCKRRKAIEVGAKVFIRKLNAPSLPEETTTTVYWLASAVLPRLGSLSRLSAVSVGTRSSFIRDLYAGGEGVRGAGRPLIFLFSLLFLARYDGPRWWWWWLNGTPLPDGSHTTFSHF